MFRLFVHQLTVRLEMEIKTKRKFFCEIDRFASKYNFDVTKYVKSGVCIISCHSQVKRKFRLGKLKRTRPCMRATVEHTSGVSGVSGVSDR